MEIQLWAIIGSIYNLGLITFHLLFWKIFNWKEDLSSLSFINRPVMQILNISLTYIFFIFAYITFFHSNELITTSMGNTLLGLISLFWLFRALEQFWFFGWKNNISLLLFLFFMIGCIIYLLPLLKTVRNAS
jgi:hypothetical protein